MTIVRRSTKSLPRFFSRGAWAPRIRLEADFWYGSASSLRLKLLVFYSKALMLRFRRERLIDGMAPGVHNEVWDDRTEGAVIQCREHRRKDGKDYWLVDPRYFALMLLSTENLGMEIITHECAHVGFAYAKRCRPDHDWIHSETVSDEEVVCYPAGKYARRINKMLHDKGLYQDEVKTA